jgi:tetratricopeptide (TPR) repeat protein
LRTGAGAPKLGDVPLLVPALVLAQVSAPPAAAEAGGALRLRAVAQASPRSGECGVVSSSERAAGFWTRTTKPELVSYCDALARGYAALRISPRAAVTAAQAAEKLFPERAAPRLLQARALARLDEFQQAFRLFEKVDVNSIAAPDALHDWAKTAAHLGRTSDAIRAYRLLASRLDLLPGRLERQRAYVEAAMWVMQLGPAALDEAIGYLLEARQEAVPPGLSPFVLGALALALDRQGRPEQARGVLAEPVSVALIEQALENTGVAARDDGSIWARTRRGALPVLPPGELRALLAIWIEAADPDDARDGWTAFLEDDAAKQSPWAGHARAKLEQKPRARRRGK